MAQVGEAQGGGEFGLETSDVFLTSGVLLGLQVFAAAYRLERAIRATEEEEKGLHGGDMDSWAAPLPPCELLNLGSMVIGALGVFTVPVLCQDGALAQLCFAAYTLLYGLYPLALLAHHELFSLALLTGGARYRRHNREPLYCTVQERNVCVIAAVAVSAVLILGIRAPGGTGAVVAAVVLLPCAVGFAVLVCRRAGDALGDDVYASLSVLETVIDEDDPDFRYEVQITFEPQDQAPHGLDLLETRDGWVEVADVRPSSLASRTPHVCPGLKLVRLYTATYEQESGYNLTVERVLRMISEERPLTLVRAQPSRATTLACSPPPRHTPPRLPNRRCCHLRSPECMGECVCVCVCV
jgi:hypothetical protein